MARVRNESPGARDEHPPCGRAGGAGCEPRGSSNMTNVRLFLVDNYDSFTYNLFQYLAELGAQVDVRRNDRFTLDEVEALRPNGIVISPGPGRPSEAGLP